MDEQNFSRDPAAVLNLFIDMVQRGKGLKSFCTTLPKNVKVPGRTNSGAQSGGPLAVLKRHIFHSSAPPSIVCTTVYRTVCLLHLLLMLSFFTCSCCTKQLYKMMVFLPPPTPKPKLSNLFLFSDLFPSSSPAPEPASSCRHSEQRHSTPAHIKDTLLAH